MPNLILIVEDLPLVRRELVNLCPKHFICKTAESRDEALIKLGITTWLALLTDNVLFGENSAVEIVEKAREVGVADQNIAVHSDDADQLRFPEKVRKIRKNDWDAIARFYAALRV